MMTVTKPVPVYQSAFQVLKTTDGGLYIDRLIGKNIIFTVNKPLKNGLI